MYHIGLLIKFYFADKKNRVKGKKFFIGDHKTLIQKRSWSLVLTAAIKQFFKKNYTSLHFQFSTHIT